jgi:DNA modification methylase
MKFRDRITDFRRVKASALAPNPRNWRKHPQAQQDALRGILSEIGYADACLARTLPDGRLQLIDGHLRAEVTPDQELPVLVLDLNDAEADKLMTVLDPLAGMAEADEAALAALIGEIETDSEALKSMLDGLCIEHKILTNPAEGASDPDDVPAPPDEAITKPGDLWILGNHRLLCGDSSKPADVDRLLGGATIQFVNTDPPYNVDVAPRTNNAYASGERRGMPRAELAEAFGGWNPKEAAEGGKPATDKKLRPRDRILKNDFISDAEFDQLLDAWFDNLARVLEPGRTFYIWGGYSNCANYPPILKAKQLHFAQAIIWDKEYPVLTRKDFLCAHEWCFYGWREGAAHQFFGPNNITDIWHVKKISPTKMIHLTEKPVELAVRAMQYSSRPGENVLDLFGGSGSTLIAAEQTGRRAFLMELDALYCDVIVQRWEQFTGKKAVCEKMK